MGSFSETYNDPKIVVDLFFYHNTDNRRLFSKPGYSRLLPS